MEHKIGEIITLPDGRKAEVVESNGLCSGCIFYLGYGDCMGIDMNVKCINQIRSDHKNIIYKEIKEE